MSASDGEITTIITTGGTALTAIITAGGTALTRK